MSDGNVEKIKCTSSAKNNNKNNELSKFQKWLKDNLLLVETLFGVIIGTILGTFTYRLIKTISIIGIIEYNSKFQSFVYLPITYVPSLC